MISYIEQGTQIYRFSNLSTFPEINHGITTRLGGFSKALYNSMNLSLNVGDDPENVQKNRQKISNVFKIDPERLLIPRQCHTDNVKQVDLTTNQGDLAETDALITNSRGCALAVLAADCVPILIYDPNKIVVAAIHAGWKGTVQNIAGTTVQKMRSQFGCNPENLFCTIGPCISTKRFEVGEEVAELFRNIFDPVFPITLPGSKPGKSNIDLILANKIQLINTGIQRENIETTELCTYNNPGLFFSARRDGNKCGRFGSIIVINN